MNSIDPDTAVTLTPEQAGGPRLVGRSVVTSCGEMVWPAVTGGVADLGWKLRYAPEHMTRGDQLTLAALVDAYIQMVADPQKKRNRVCREIVTASRAEAKR